MHPKFYFVAIDSASSVLSVFLVSSIYCKTKLESISWDFYFYFMYITWFHHSIHIAISNQTSIRHFLEFCGCGEREHAFSTWDLHKGQALVRYWDIHVLWYMKWCSGFWSMQDYSLIYKSSSRIRLASMMWCWRLPPGAPFTNMV